MKKFSCGHPQRLPLLYVVYEYTHVVKPDILFRMLFWLSSFPSIAWSSFFVSSCIHIPFFYVTTSPLLWIYAQQYTKMYFPHPLSLDIWILPFFFHLINCNKCPCMLTLYDFKISLWIYLFSSYMTQASYLWKYTGCSTHWDTDCTVSLQPGIESNFLFLPISAWQKF